MHIVSRIMQKMYLPLTLVLFGFYSVCTNGLPLLTDDQNAKLNKLLSTGSLSFAMELISNLHHQAGADENIIISPINIYAVLAMVHLGSSGDTRDALANTLGFPKNDNQVPDVHEALGKVLKHLQKKDQYSVSEVAIANGLFIQKDYPLLTSYTDQIKKYYNGDPTNVDFNKNPKDTMDLINKWVSDSTKNRIPQLYAAPLDPLTKIVIAGSLYFNGRWHERFPKSNTKAEKFNTGVRDIEVQMMNDIDDVPYFDNPILQFEAIQLAYDGYEYTMAIILPYESQNIMNLTHHLKAEDLQKVFDNSTYTGIDYKIPRMKFSWKKSLVETLSMQGLKGIFENSDLRNMLSANNLKISDVTHAAEIEVDESGTVASAITTVQMVLTSLPMPPQNPKPFVVNRPFITAIYHKPTATTLFMALVHQPTGSST